MADSKKQRQAKLFNDLRRKAEHLMQANPAESKNNGAQDLNSLLHELEVHQIELALQNEELLRSRAEIEESRQKYLDLYDFAPVGYITYDDRTGHITETNHAGAGMLGCEKGTAVGKKLMSFIMPESQDVFYFHKNKCFETREKQTCELKLKKKGHPPVPVQLSSMPVDAEGPMKLLRIALTDISERTLLWDQLRESRKTEAIGTLAGGIAHEFNNMLGGITNYAELAKADMPADRPAREYLDEVLKLCKKARDVVMQVLSYSQKPRTEYKPVVVHSLVAETVKLMRSSIPTNIDIRQDIDGQAGTVLGNHTQIQQVLINLCINAAQAMKLKSGLLTIKVVPVALDAEQVRHFTDLRAGAYVKLTVSDTGTGFDPAITERIFDPFFTTKEVGDGRGMGLAEAQGIVKSHGGAITVSSILGAGTTVTVFFPASADAAAVNAPDTRLQGGTERILMVDDEECIVIPAKMMLENLGYRVTALTDSLETLELFRKTPDDFDFVITDLSMPHLTGERLAAEIIKIRKDIPVVIATGFVGAADNEDLKKSGVRGVIAKPYSMQEFAKSIRSILDGT